MMLFEAVEIVAKQVARDRVEDATWEDYPEMSEADWWAVHAELLRSHPAQPMYRDARELLEARVVNGDR